MKFQFTCSGTCSRAIDIEVSDDGIVKRVEFIGGCHGNTQGISALVEGVPAIEVVSRLKGIRCKTKQTSCPDQLAQALEQMEISKK